MDKSIGVILLGAGGLLLATQYGSSTKKEDNVSGGSAFTNTGQYDLAFLNPSQLSGASGQVPATATELSSSQIPAPTFIINESNDTPTNVFNPSNQTTTTKKESAMSPYTSLSSSSPIGTTAPVVINGKTTGYEVMTKYGGVSTTNPSAYTPKKVESAPKTNVVAKVFSFLKRGIFL